MAKKLFSLLILGFVVLSGCGQPKIKDNQIYQAERRKNRTGVEWVDADLSKVEGRNPFEEFISVSIDQLGIESSGDDVIGEPIILTYSPDSKIVYYMERLESDEKIVVLSGETSLKTRLIKLDTGSGKQVVLAENIPFINTVKWNKDRTIVAFAGGDRITIYDQAQDKLLLKEEEINNDRVSYFGWSPQGEQIFAEHPNLPNGSIYYLGNEPKIEHCYENKIELYYKGQLNDDYFYATWTYVEENEKGDAIGVCSRTVLLDQEGRIVREFGIGRFRDAYQRSMLQIGESKFGLQYYPDVNKADQFKLLTEEYVYDAKFITGGKIAYTVQNKDKINLCIADREGRQLKRLEVSGGSIALSPDGKTGYIGARCCEKINFDRDDVLVKTKTQAFNEEEKEIYTAIWGAMDVYFKHEMTGIEDYEGAKTYFLDTHNPEGWAYFEMLTRFKEMKYKSIYNLYKYRIRVEIQKPIKYSGSSRASASIGASGENSMGSGMGMGCSLELIKADGKWYVTGFSTFPDSPQAKQVKQQVEKVVKKARAGSLFEGVLKGKEVEIGQIQFWQLSAPHLASNAETANYSKVYLKVKENGEETVYKLVLVKSGGSWKVNSLDQERLSYLF